MCVCPLATCPSHFQRPGFDKATHSVGKGFEPDVCVTERRGERMDKSKSDRQRTV